MPPLFGWLWALGGAGWLFGSLLAAAGAGLTVLAAVRLARQLEISALPVALMTAFLASLTRYGAQPLPDSLYLALHLFVLSEIATRDPVRWRLGTGLFLLPWLRLDGLLFAPLYLAWHLAVRDRSARSVIPLAGALLASVLMMSTVTCLRTGEFLPTTRLSVLYSGIGEDQAVDGTTLWHELANRGRVAPDWAEDAVNRAVAAAVPRESTNADGATWIGNAGTLLAYGLWDAEHLTPVLLPFALLGMLSVKRRHRSLALLAVISVAVYGFLGVRERYLQFSEVLWILLIARGLTLLLPKKVIIGVLAVWIGWQVKVGTYHYRNPGILPVEHRLAGEWIGDQAGTGGVMSRQGQSALYADRTWFRLPTNPLPDLERVARDHGIGWVVVGSRDDPARRPWQPWLVDGKVPAGWQRVKQFDVNEGDRVHRAVIYRVKRADR